MQEAYCEVDDSVYTALQFEGLGDDRRNILAGRFRCCFCNEAAHFRSRARNGRKPCFYSLPHGENCQITRVERDPWGDDDEARINAAGSRGGRLVVKIAGDDDPEAEASDGLSVDSQGSDRRTRTGGSGASRTNNSIQRGPQRILEILLQRPTFVTSTTPVRFRDGSELPVHAAFVRFEHANYQRHVDHWHGFWGRLPYPSRWQYGSSYYFNFGSQDADFRIALSDTHVQRILERYSLNSAQDLAGGWMILFDVARVSTSGRFTADVISPNHIGFVRARG